MIRISIFILWLVFNAFQVLAQTCCSGGIPLSSNIGFVGAEQSTWQFSTTYDYHYLNQLYKNSTKLEDKSRARFTRSVIIEGGYQLTSSFSVDAFLPYIWQEREIYHFGETDKAVTGGIGDIAVLFKYSLFFKDKGELQVALGPKFPSGKSNIKSELGIAYNADLQPGSGTLDAIFAGSYSRAFTFRPTMSIFSRMLYKLNGTNKDYLDAFHYKFGNELQYALGVSDQLLLGNFVISPSLVFRYRNVTMDEQDNVSFPNTGGDWIILNAGTGISVVKNLQFFLSGEIPVLTNVGGVQLSTTYRLTTGFYLWINNDRDVNFIPVKF